MVEVLTACSMKDGEEGGGGGERGAEETCSRVSGPLKVVALTRAPLTSGERGGEGREASVEDLLSLTGRVATFDCEKECKDYILHNRESLLDNGPAILSFVASCLATRGLNEIRDCDMDDSEVPFIGMFGYCSQELVNLILTGRATSNVFDGEKLLGSDPETDIKLKGVTRCDAKVGFLSELETHRLLEVGTVYKYPPYPVWVLGSSNHYTTMFCTDIAACRAGQGPRLAQVSYSVSPSIGGSLGGQPVSERKGCRPTRHR
eukprot:GHVU01223243.1.p1 GENE.GHVU01223243.1~~GHVU01223243.1.p1  ORF type:complete len:261 (-),score=29.19 GHVU01223243.1:1026-1808(-)